MLIEGKKVSLGGEELILPPLPMKVFRTHPAWFEAVSSITGIPNEKQVEAICGLIGMALQRNYPEKGPEWVEDNVDMGQGIMLLAEVMNVSRFLKNPDGSPGGAAPVS